MKISELIFRISFVITQSILMVVCIYNHHIILAFLNLVCAILHLYFIYKIPHLKILLISNNRNNLNLSEIFTSLKIHKRIYYFNVDTITPEQFLNNESIRNSKIQNNTDYLIDVKLPDELKQDIFKIFRSINDIQ